MVIVFLAIVVMSGIQLLESENYYGHAQVTELDAKSFDAAAIAMIEARTGLEFPHGTQGLHLYVREGFPDPAFVAKLTIPNHSIESFRHQVAKLPDSNPTISTTLTARPWWQPEHDTTILKRAFLHSGSSGVEVFLCMEEHSWVVYVLWMHM